MERITSVMHTLLDLSPIQILVGAVLVCLVPILLHAAVFEAGGVKSLPSILLVGPSGAGKTSLLVLVWCRLYVMAT
jgi:signal recognition particle receptor subunit beta